jgi:hypothetical protein
MIASWAEASPQQLRPLRGLCLDIDETLSTAGKLTAPAYDALWRLHDAGFAVVPVTGRPAGWCDHIARFWPVHAVVGENGAFTFFMQDGVRRRLDTPSGGADDSPKRRLDELARRVQERFPHARWASDQPYREHDLAVDLCEDVPPWPRADVETLLALCRSAGARAKVSSIHLNAWFGDYDKTRGFRHWLDSGAPGLPTPPSGAEAWLFVGDSPNDEPLFESFHRSVAVANLGRFLGDVKHLPTWITKGEAGAGFVEVVDRLLASRRP